jgi:hypothetical protein
VLLLVLLMLFRRQGIERNDGNGRSSAFAANGTSFQHHDFGRQARWIVLQGEMLLGKGHVEHSEQAVGFVMPGEPLRVRKRWDQHQSGEADDGQSYRHSHLRPWQCATKVLRHLGGDA